MSATEVNRRFRILSRSLFVLLSMAGNHLMWETTSAQTSRYPFLCLPAESAWIADIRLGDSPTDVERKLGSPEDRAVAFGEDDGGTYEETQLSYPTLDVFIVRGVVDRVVTTDPMTCTAGGICPGLTQQQVRSRLDVIAPELAAAEPASIVLCPEEGFLSDYYLTIEYTRAGEAAKLELALDRP